MVEANGVDLCIQTFGDEGDPAILLIGGMAASMDWWDEELCVLLASGDRFVIRYDLRDTGQSVTYEPGAPGYGDDDLVADAAGLLDALEVVRAHVVGISMGGGIAQVLALEHPDRVASLTLLSTSPVVSTGRRLPPPSAELAAHLSNPLPEPDWSDREAVVDYIVEDQRPYAGRLPFDEAGLRALAEKIVDRTIDMQSSLTNHALVESGDAARPSLSVLTAPTLVLHGTDDPFLPFGHGEALAAEIPDARLVPLVGVGHEMPPPAVWDTVVAAILEHTAAR
jgi:pimeloyl-ACP methyl ester carboxylesterase